MQVLVEDSEIAETDIPYPEAGCRPYGRDGVGTDQEPQQVMMDKLGQGKNADIVTFHMELFLKPFVASPHYS
jgi:hypothetical protein